MYEEEELGPNSHKPFSEAYDKPVDEEKEKIISDILEWDIRLSNLRQLYSCQPSYAVFDYRSRNLYNFDKEALRKILRNIINQICDILRQIGYEPDSYTKYRSKRYKLKPGFANYWVSKIAPSRLAQTLFPHFLSEVTLDELDMEYLNFIGPNLSSLCRLELSKLEYLIENGKVKESDVIKTIRKDLLQRPNIDPQLRRTVEDELFLYELSHKPEKQQRQLMDFYRKYFEAMDDREKDHERQQQRLLADGLRRRKELEELKQGKPIKRKEQIGISAAEEICKRLSTKSRQRREGTK